MLLVPRQSKWQDVVSLAELLLLVRLVSLIVLVLTLELVHFAAGFSGDPRSNFNFGRKISNAAPSALVPTSRCGGAREMGGCGRPAWVRRAKV